jgi:NitT/TauT family transport system substrate-binding protein
MKQRRTPALGIIALTGVLGLGMASCSKDSASTDAESTEAAASEAGATEAGDTEAAATEATAESSVAGAAPATEAAAPGTDAAAAGAPAAECTTPSPVKLQLQWVTQAQFAGYYAAVDQGFYKGQCLDVTIMEGGVDIVPQTQLATGAVDYAISWVPKALASREQGAAITNVAQIFERSGTLQVSWKDSNITTAADLKGKKVGNWGFGNEFELFAGMTAAGLDPSKDVTNVQQNFDMQALLKKEIDAAQAMTYNEYAQVLEAKGPDGKLYTADQFSVIDWNKEGTAMLQDAIWANTDKLKDAAYADQTARFVKASIQGWVFCRDNADKCVDIVIAKGSKLGKSHQAWQMNEINKLIWPSSAGIGMINQNQWDQTVKVAKEAKNAEGATVLTKDPDAAAFSNDYVKKALEEWKAAGVDVDGTSYAPATVTLNEGGA